MFFSGTLWSVAPWWLAAATLVAVGGALLIGRRSPRATCPRCRYDMSAASERGRCPECGLPFASPRSLFRRRRRPWSGILLLLAAAVLASSPFRVALGVWATKTFLPRYVAVASGKAGPVRVVIEHDRWNDLGSGEFTGPDRAVIELADGSRHMVASGMSFQFGVASSAGGASSPLPPDDSVGFGKPFDREGETDVQDDAAELVLTIPSGGSGGYAKTIVLALEPMAFEPVAVLENAWLDDSDGDGVPTMVGFDGAFAYRWTSGAGATRPLVHLKRLGPGRFTLDAERMRRTAPDDATLASLVETISNADASDRESWLSPLLRGTIGLLYGGEAAKAQRFLTAHWRGTQDELATFEREFHAVFAASPYAGQVRALSSEPSPWP